MNFIARSITELIQLASFVAAAIAGFLTFRIYQELRAAPAKDAAEAVPQIFGVHAVIFMGSVTLIALAFFLLASTCRAILETARNTSRLVDKMDA